MRPPDLMSSAWRCDHCGPTPPLHRTERISSEILTATTDRAAELGFPVWCLWPLPTGWTVTGVAWVGDERSGISATALACTGPSPLTDGPADLVFVAEELSVGLGARLAGLPGPDPGPQLSELAQSSEAHAKVRTGGRPTPLWALDTPDDRSVYVGEAMGRWLWAVAFPAPAGYLLTEPVELQDLAEWQPTELVFGASSPYLQG
ncbi:hypothetical protein F4553_003860 [Allocatelliglobosispora scoriae]|uniref:Uncharacterized protein n=1 Tax=Allocatelliglobosispora scoriae TaxID=643052 RepID=A0A841BUQ3_9ACTN|nr:hypothetical protein [Allocatelliglobosispora scoriae]